MARTPGKSSLVLLVLSLWILAFPGSMADDNNDPDALNQQVTELIAQWKFQEALQIAREALELAKRTRGLEDPETAAALGNLGFILEKIENYAEAEPLLEEAVRIRRKILGSDHPDTAASLNDLALLYEDL